MRSRSDTKLLRALQRTTSRAAKLRTQLAAATKELKRLEDVKQARVMELVKDAEPPA